MTTGTLVRAGLAGLVTHATAQTAPAARPVRILFVGNSFTVGARSAVRGYWPDLVTT